jgi:Tol biopolymer transport system component
MIPRALLLAAFIGATLLSSGAIAAQTEILARLPLKPVRTIEFATEEGTWLNIDVSPDGSRLVFDMLGNLYTLPIGGGKAQALTSGIGWNTQPRFSPDGRSIVFVSDRAGSDNLWLMPVNGGEARQLTHERGLLVVGSPAWSPDGRSIVARRGHGSLFFQELLLYPADGGAGSQLFSPGTGGSWHGVSGPVISPDGRHVYYSATVPLPFAFLTADVSRQQLFRMDLRTGETEQLTSGYGGGLRPSLSPDGRWLVYGARDGGRGALRIRRLEDGSEEWLIRGIDRDMQEYASGDDTRPSYAFTPDGLGIVVWYHGKIHRVDLTTRQVDTIPFAVNVRRELAARPTFERRIEDGPLQVRHIRWPAFSPDGRRLVFSAVGKLWVAELPGGVPGRLTEATGREVYPSFSPDGQSIAWASWSDSAGGHIWKLASGGRPVQLTSVAGFYQAPVWSADGSRIAFVRGSARAYHARDWTETQIIAWVPAEGGPVTDVARSPLSQPGQWGIPPQLITWSGDGERLFFLDHESPPGNQLYVPHTLKLKSVDLRGAAERVHATIEAGDIAVPSPDGRWLAFGVRSGLFLASLPLTTEAPIHLTAEDRRYPVRPLAPDGGIDVRWNSDGQGLTWSLAEHVFRVDLADALAGRLSDSLAVDLRIPRRRGSGTYALRGARIITLKADEVIERGDIVVVDGRISAVGPAGSVSIPTDATTLDVSGKVIIPGLIDVHAHPGPRRDVVPERMWSFAAHLAYGVTTAFDPDGFHNPSTFAHAEMIEAGELVGPRYFGAGRHLDPMVAPVESLDDAQRLARRYQRQGSIMLKEYLYPRREQEQWLRMAAEEFGMNTSSEGAGYLAGQLRSAVDGYTGFEHFLGAAPVYRDVIELLARSGTYYDPTLGIDQGGVPVQYFFRQRSRLHEDAKLGRFIPDELMSRYTRRTTMAVDDEFRLHDLVAGATAVLRAGGHVTVGGHEHKGLPTHWEIWAYVEGGMTPREALRAGTLAGAEALGMQRDLGSLEPGKLADLLVLNRDPLADIRATADIRYVMKAGELFDGDTLDRLWPEQRSFGPFYWQQGTVDPNSR